MRTTVQPHGTGWDVRTADGLMAHYHDRATAERVAVRLNARLKEDGRLPSAKLPPLTDHFTLRA